MTRDELTYTVVGAGGFIGENLVKRLCEAGHRVCMVDRVHRLERLRHVPTSCRRVIWEPDDEVSRLHDALNDTDVLIVLSWTSQPAQSMTSMVNDAEQNIIRSLELFQYAAKLDVRRIVFASSGGTVYGNVDAVPIPEVTPLRPVSAYGVSKVAVEQYLGLIAFHYGLTGISLRIGNPYGPYQLAGLSIGIIANFLLRAIRKEPLTIYGDGETVRDYVWIDDLTKAFELAGEVVSLPSGAYNIGSGTGYSINDIATIIENRFPELGKRNYKSSRSFDARRIVLDTTKFQHASGWSPTCSLDVGVETMIESAFSAADLDLVCAPDTNRTGL